MTLLKTISENTDTEKLLRFGFLGLGRGGGLIAAACADIESKTLNNRFPYSALIINTSANDINKDKIVNPSTKEIIIGSGKGTAKDMAIGNKVFKENVEIITTELKNHFQDTDFLWITLGLGGGSGTGFLKESINLLKENGFDKRFGLIIMLPRITEGHNTLTNVLKGLATINQLMFDQGAVIIIDNEKIYNHFYETNRNALVGEAFRFSTNFVRETLHELNIITSNYKPVGKPYLDRSKFENLLKTPGVLHLTKFSDEMNVNDPGHEFPSELKLKKIIGEGVISDNYNFTTSQNSAVGILSNSNPPNGVSSLENKNTIGSIINHFTSTTEEETITFYEYKSDILHSVFYYALFAGLEMPKRVSEIEAETIRFKNLINTLHTDRDA